jgi:catechol-2,3-dioxygenase
VSTPLGKYPGDRTASGIVGLETVVYGVEDLALSARFFEDFGLETVERGDHGRTFEMPEKTSLQLRLHDDASLPAAPEAGSTIREIVWGVDTAEHVNALGAELATDRAVTTDSEGTIHTVDDAGYGIAFTVTKREAVILEPQTLNTIGEVVRHNERAAFYDQAKPQHLGHIVLYCPNWEEQVSFYVDRLKFMISDTLRGSGAFLRCSVDHHNLFLLRYPSTGLNHISFGVQGIDEIMGGYKVMSESGWEPTWGLGRHYIGSNIFYYFRNPAGGQVEYYADMDCITNPELWTPEEFEANTPEALFAWGGYPPPGYRKTYSEVQAEMANLPGASG